MERFLIVLISAATERVSLRALALLLALCCSLMSVVPVVAQQREIAGEKSEKVDAILLLDSSGSMLVNDPQRLRDEGARLFAQFLKSGDSLAIIDFADEAKVVRPLTPYDPEQLDEVTRLISSIRTEGQFTDLLQGIEKASAILNEAGRSDAKPVVVLLSDGKMEPSPRSGTASARTQIMLEEVLPEMKSRGRRVYTLAFSKDADKELLQQIASGTDAVQWFTESADQVHESYAQLFLAVKKPQVIPLSDKGFSIDENVAEATFYINRDGENEVKVQHPSGQVFTSSDHPKNIKWFNSPRFEVITIEKPDVGLWRIGGVSPDDGFATILTNLKLVTDWGPPIDAGSTEVLQARMYESQKPVSLPEMTGMIKYAYQITPTDKISEPVVRDFLGDDGRQGDKIESDGIFSHSVTIDEPGEYVLRIIAKAPTFERQLQIPFRVKAPLITLTAEERAGGAGQSYKEAAHKEAAHGEAGHHTDSQANAHGKGEENKGHGAVSAEHADGEHGEAKKPDEKGLSSGNEDTAFVIELGDEAKSLKNVSVELSAVDESRKKLVIPLEKAGESGRFFEASASKLSHDGRWDLRATLSAEGRGKTSVHQSSRVLSFKRISSGRAPQEVQVVEVKKEEEAVGFPVLGLFLMMILIAGGGGAGFVLVKRSSAASSIAVKENPIPQEILSAIQDLEERSAQTEVDLNDPSFDEEPQAAA